MLIKKRIWTEIQLAQLEDLGEEFHIPKAVQTEIHSIVHILDDNYGRSRDVDRDDGGYVLLLLSEDEGEVHGAYDSLLQKYSLQQELAEYEDVIIQDRQKEWHIILFLVGSEYGITIVYPEKREEKNG